MAIWILFASALALGSCFYIVLDFRLYKGLKRLHRGRREDLPQVSILVSARNEEANIADCLKNLLQQDYPAENFEIIVTNDRSEDKTPEILDKLAEKFSQKLKIIHQSQVKDGISPKKQALERMVQLAKGEIILCTDADCEVPSGWVRSMAKEFTPGVLFVAGHSELVPPKYGIFYGIQSLEFFSYSVISAGSISMRFPITSSGNNLGYRRDFFLEAEGYRGVDHILSGDDDFLMQKAFARSRDGVRYCIEPESFVRTRPEHSLSGFMNQRRRWASKTVHYSKALVALMSGIFGFYALLFGITLFGCLLDWRLSIVALVVWIIKISMDYIVMRKGAQIFHKSHLMKYFLGAQIFQIPMILIAVIFGISGSFNWKGRQGKALR